MSGLVIGLVVGIIVGALLIVFCLKSICKEKAVSHKQQEEEEEYEVFSILL